MSNQFSSHGCEYLAQEDCDLVDVRSVPDNLEGQISNRIVKRGSRLSDGLCAGSSEPQSVVSGDYDEVDAPFLVHIDNLSLNKQNPEKTRESMLNHLSWYDAKLDDAHDNSEPASLCSGSSAKQIVPKVRYILICFYFVIYSGLVLTVSPCSKESCSMDAESQSETEDIFNVSTLHECTCGGYENLLRSFKYPLISIAGAILISVVTRSVIFFVALCTWRCTTKDAFVGTFGPFRQMKNILFVVIVVFLILIVYGLSVLAFGEEFRFEWEEIFAPAGLATLIVAVVGFEGDTDFEESFKRNQEKYGYVYGLAHQYFKSSLDPLLKPEGKRDTVIQRWADYGPSEMILVLLVESYHLVEELFTKEEFSQEVSFVDNFGGLYLMRLAVAETEDNQVAYVNVPVLINEHLLIIDEWFSNTCHVTVPMVEQKLKYLEELRKLLFDKRLSTGGALGRVFFVHVLRDSDIKSVPTLLRQAIYKELGSPNTRKFRENAKLAEDATASFSNDSGNVSPSNSRPRRPKLSNSLKITH